MADVIITPVSESVFNVSVNAVDPDLAQLAADAEASAVSAAASAVEAGEAVVSAETSASNAASSASESAQSAIDAENAILVQNAGNITPTSSPIVDGLNRNYYPVESGIYPDFSNITVDITLGENIITGNTVDGFSLRTIPLDLNAFSEKLDKTFDAVFVDDPAVIQGFGGGFTFYETATFQRIGFGVLLSLGEKLDSIDLELEIPSGCKKIRIDIFNRILSEISSSLSPGNTSSSDVLNQQITLLDGVDFNSPDSNVNINVPISSIKYSEGAPLILMWVRPYTELDAVSQLSMKVLDTGSTSLTTYQKGWQRGSGTDDNAGAPSFTTIAPYVWARNMIGSVEKNMITDIDSRLSLVESEIPDLIDRVVMEYSLSELNLTLNGSVNSMGLIIPFSDVLPISQTPVLSGSVNNYSLVYNTNLSFPGGSSYLAHRGIHNPVVIRVSDSAVLTEGVDYVVIPDGKINGLINIPNFNVNITYDYLNVRYDLVQVDRISGVVSIVSGEERAIEVPEYLPIPESGKMPLLHLRVQGVEINIIDVSNLEGGIELKSLADMDALVRRNINFLPKLIGKIRRGDSVTIQSYGDSITSQQAATPLFTANGVLRDRPEYFSNYPSDTIATVALYDFGDGGGAIHTKVGWCWQLVNKLEEIGNTVVYENFGIGGTASNSNPSNGLDPIRIAEILASPGDVVILAFGMNEISSTAILPNTIDMIGQFRGVGKEVIVMGVPERHPTFTDSTNLRRTNQLLVMAAQYTNCAYVPFNWVTDQKLRSIGLYNEDVCSTNMANHPGIYELKKYGEFLVKCIGL